MGHLCLNNTYSFQLGIVHFLTISYRRFLEYLAVMLCSFPYRNILWTFHVAIFLISVVVEFSFLAVFHGSLSCFRCTVQGILLSSNLEDPVIYIHVYFPAGSWSSMSMISNVFLFQSPFLPMVSWSAYKTFFFCCDTIVGTYARSNIMSYATLFSFTVFNLLILFFSEKNFYHYICSLFLFAPDVD